MRFFFFSLLFFLFCLFSSVNQPLDDVTKTLVAFFVIIKCKRVETKTQIQGEGKKKNKNEKKIFPSPKLMMILTFL